MFGNGIASTPTGPLVSLTIIVDFFCCVPQVVPLNQARDFNNNTRAIYVFKVNASVCALCVRNLDSIDVYYLFPSAFVSFKLII